MFRGIFNLKKKKVPTLGILNFQNYHYFIVVYNLKPYFNRVNKATSYLNTYNKSNLTYLYNNL